MQYTLEWFDDSQQVLLVQFESEIDWSNFHTIVDEAYKLVKATSHPVDLLMWHKTGHLPAGNPMIHFKSVIDRQPANTRRVIVINPDLNSGLGRYVAHIARMLMRLMPKAGDVELLGSYEEACARLNLKQPA